MISPFSLPSFFLEIINYVFLGIFTLEMILKLIGYGRSYFMDGWNLFDFFIIISSYVSLILDLLIEGLNIGSSASVIRTFRISRILRLINKAKGLRTMFNTIIITIPALANIGGLLAIIIFIYAILGTNLFAYIKP